MIGVAIAIAIQTLALLGDAAASIADSEKRGSLLDLRSVLGKVGEGDFSKGSQATALH